jgi:hypothetical protein
VIPKRHHPLVLSCLALVGALFLAGVGVVRWVANPPPPQCTLPRVALPFVAKRFVWAPDSRRLLVAGPDGQAAIVRFPGGTVSPLPRVPRAPYLLSWDRAGRPLVVVTEPRSVCLNRLVNGNRWKTMRLPGMHPSLSPDGARLVLFRLAADNAEPPGELRGPMRFGAVEVVDLERGVREKVLRRRPSSDIGSWWLDDETVRIVMAAPGEGSGTLEYRVRDGSVSEVHPRSTTVPLREPSIHADRRSEPPPYARIRHLLRTWNVPGVPPLDAEDHYLVVLDWHRQAGGRWPLGRIPPAPAGFASAASLGLVGPWEPGGSPHRPALSRDGRYVAVTAADESPRVLDLQGGMGRR